GVSVIANGVIDPFRSVPICVGRAYPRGQVFYQFLGGDALLRSLQDGIRHFIHVGGNGRQDFGAAHRAMTWNHNGWPPFQHVVEHSLPSRGIEDGVVRGEPGKNRKYALLGEVAGKQDLFFWQPYDLVACSMGRPPRMEFNYAAAQIDTM